MGDARLLNRGVWECRAKLDGVRLCCDRVGVWIGVLVGLEGGRSAGEVACWRYSAMTSLTGVGMGSGNEPWIDDSWAGAICSGVTTPRLKGNTPVTRNAERMVSGLNARLAAAK